MDPVSLTTFVDFCAKAGTQRLTVVRKAKKDAATKYSHYQDFWKGIRDSIIRFHQKGSSDRRIIDEAMKNVSDKTKLQNFPPMIAAYKKFLGRKKVSWFKPMHECWNVQNFSVRVNPELGLRINQEPHLIKMYFKSDPLTSDRIKLILHLMQLCIATNNKQPVMKMAILDVRNSKLFVANKLDPTLTPLLIGDAISFATMYDML